MHIDISMYAHMNTHTHAHTHAYKSTCIHTHCKIQSTFKKREKERECVL